MLRLTEQERKVVVVIIFLLLVGWGVKAWRENQPLPSPAAQSIADEHNREF